jgi:hypothetical protein
MDAFALRRSQESVTRRLGRSVVLASLAIIWTDGVDGSFAYRDRIRVCWSKHQTRATSLVVVGNLREQKRPLFLHGASTMVLRTHFQPAA